MIRESAKRSKEMLRHIVEVCPANAQSVRLLASPTIAAAANAAAAAANAATNAAAANAAATAAVALVARRRPSACATEAISGTRYVAFPCPLRVPQAILPRVRYIEAFEWQEPRRPAGLEHDPMGREGPRPLEHGPRRHQLPWLQPEIKVEEEDPTDAWIGAMEACNLSHARIGNFEAPAAVVRPMAGGGALATDVAGAE